MLVSAHSVITFSPIDVSLTALRIPIGTRKNSDMPTARSSPHTGNCSGVVSTRTVAAPNDKQSVTRYQVDGTFG